MGALDLVNTVTTFRSQRIGMVQTLVKFLRILALSLRIKLVIIFSPWMICLKTYFPKISGKRICFIFSISRYYDMFVAHHVCCSICRSSISSAMMWSSMNLKISYQMGTLTVVCKDICRFMGEVIRIGFWNSRIHTFPQSSTHLLLVGLDRWQVVQKKSRSYLNRLEMATSYALPPYICRPATNSSKIHHISVIFWCTIAILTV